MVQNNDSENTNNAEVKDILGNVISWVYSSNEGIIVFSVNGTEMTTWSCEDDPAMTAYDFVKNWNFTQAITLRSINLSKKETAEFVLQNECDTYSEEDVEMVINELKHVDTWLSNTATTIEAN